jgi:hypothetical protein
MLPVEWAVFKPLGRIRPNENNIPVMWKIIISGRFEGKKTYPPCN